MFSKTLFGSMRLNIYMCVYVCVCVCFCVCVHECVCVCVCVYDVYVVFQKNGYNFVIL